MRTGLASLSLVAMAALSRPALAQTLGQGQGPEIAWWRVVAALLFCLMLGLVAAFALRARMGGAAAPSRLTFPFGPGLRLPAHAERRLKLVESLRLAPQVSVSLVSCDGAEFIVAAAPHGVAVTPVSNGSQ